MTEQKIGLIGLDTSHVTAFASLINDSADPNHIDGARVVAAFPGGSKDFELSWSRVDGYTKELRDNFDVEILESPEDVCERVDLVFINAVDGRVHRALFERTVQFKKPTFIDKPFATTLADAQAMVDLSEKHGVPLMSSSSYRYSEPLLDGLSKISPDELVGIDVFGPMSLQATQPGLFWYGVHSVEMLVSVLGCGCRRVAAMANDEFDLVTGVWADGRIGTFRGSRRGHHHFGATLHGPDDFQFIDTRGGRPPYACLIDAILRSLPQGRSDVPSDQMLEVVRFIEAANKSRESGQPVEV